MNTIATFLLATVTVTAIAQSSAPPVAFRQRRLQNGMTVLSSPSHKNPTTAIQLWYRVGGKNDPVGKSGFAHLFEHLMFKATKNMKAETMDRLTEDIGGENNAFTTEDRTVYHETVPSNYLETLLWAESERMANLVIDNKNFFSERAVVEEEYRQSVLAQPYGRLNEFVNQHAFNVHPYSRGVIGSIANLDAANVEDVRRFHAMYYRPDNAVLVVTGDFTSEQLDAWVDRYFGRIPNPGTPIARVTVKEPARTAARRYNETGPNVPLPGVVISYLTGSAASDDAAALNIAAVILSKGSSSRLYQSLVYRQRIATEASASADLREDNGLFSFSTITAGGKSLDAAENATLTEISKIATQPVSAAELDKARNQLVAEALGNRETAEGTAFALADALVTLGDANRINTQIQKLQAVTANDVLRVARKYFRPENSVTVRYTSRDAEQGGVSKAGTPPAAELETPFAPTETPPAPAAPRDPAQIKVVERKLANGLKVVTAPGGRTGLVTVIAEIKSGSANDPLSTAGLADFTASLLTRGTKSRTATAIATEAETFGGSISSGSGWDSSSLTLSTLATKIPHAMALFADVLLHPSFATEEQHRLKSEDLDELTVNLQEPSTLDAYAAARVIFGDSIYGHQPGGTPESLKAIKESGPAEFYSRYYSPENTVLVFGGDITPDTAFALAKYYFGNWKANPHSPPTKAVDAPVALSGGRVVVIDKQDAGQSAVFMVREGIRRSDADYPVARVANGVLGDGYSARLNFEIRIKRGLSYGAGSRFDSRKQGGLFLASAQTRNDAVPAVVELMRQELARLAETPVPETELVSRRACLSGNYLRPLQSGAGITGAVAGLEVYDLPTTTVNDYVRKIRSVGAESIQEFAKTRMSIDKASIVVVGDGRQFLSELSKKYPQLEVIPAAQLDLNRKELMKR